MPRERFFVCRPSFYGVEYVINPWMEGNVGSADRALATTQWERFLEALSARADVEVMEPAPGLPDMAFTANAGLVDRNLFVPARFRFRERHPETRHFAEWFRRRGYRVVELPTQSSFEGEGDALFQPGEPLLWAGYGVRTSLQAHRYLSDILDLEVVPLRLVDPRFYHLDTCFCPLPGGRVIYYADAFDADSRALIASRFAAERHYAIDASDALSFACNAVVTGGAFLTNFAGSELRARLAAWGLETVVCPLTEFLRAGGAAKCLVLRLAHDHGKRARRRGELRFFECIVEIRGHLLDGGLLNRILDDAEEEGGSVEVENFRPGFRHDQDSWAQLRVVAPSSRRLETIRRRLIEMGARVASDDADAHTEPVTKAGVAPDAFYATTIFPTDVRAGGRWIRAGGQRMDAVLVVSRTDDAAEARCCLLRDLRPNDRVVCGSAGVRVHPPAGDGDGDPFGFMSASVSSERRVELAVARIAEEMRATRARGGSIVVVAGPVVIHTGGGRHLASLIRNGYVQALLGGNGLAVHDIEYALFGTSLGIDLERGVAIPGGHQHHLRAINRIRACGGIAAAVRRRMLRSGVMYECVTHGVPFVLAGSIRDDGPLPETAMDLTAAQREYAEVIGGADMILMLSSMLHAIGVGNMTPAGVRLICVDISPAVVTKLADRGSLESTGIVTDVGLFLNLLESSLTRREAAAEQGETTWRRAVHQ
jgi:lysine-ketoglutarate reductase/saccharopine dehydrogenase-like protein (TIGR00300 family)